MVQLREKDADGKEFLEKANIDSKYIKFEQGGPYNTNSLDIDLKVSSENNNENIKFKEYLKLCLNINLSNPFQLVPKKHH